MTLDRFKLILDGLVESGSLKADAKYTVVAAALDYHAAGQSEVFRLIEQMRADRVANILKDN